jgi:hypothetical protein
MAADRTEAPRVKAGDVVGAETTHRDTADRHAAWVCVEAPDHLRDHLLGDVAAPGAVGPIVPVGVITTVGEGDDRRP